MARIVYSFKWIVCLPFIPIILIQEYENITVEEPGLSNFSKFFFSIKSFEMICLDIAFECLLSYGESSIMYYFNNADWK